MISTLMVLKVSLVLVCIPMLAFILVNESTDTIASKSQMSPTSSTKKESALNTIIGFFFTSFVVLVVSMSISQKYTQKQYFREDIREESRPVMHLNEDDIPGITEV